MESLVEIIILAFIIIGFVLVAAIVADRNINKDQ